MTSHNITLQNYCLTTQGLELNYSLDKSVHKLFLPPQATAELLCDLQYLVDYKVRNRKLYVRREITEKVVTPKGKIRYKLQGYETVTWQYLVKNFTIDEVIAEEIVLQIESERTVAPVSC